MGPCRTHRHVHPVGAGLFEDFRSNCRWMTYPIWMWPVDARLVLYVPYIEEQTRRCYLVGLAS